MNKLSVLLFLLLYVACGQGMAQTNPVMDIFPDGTILHGNIPYNNDTLTKHLLDIYLPAEAKGKIYSV